MADFLELTDLYSRVGSRKVNGYFDDNNNGVVSDESQAVDDVLSAAEGEMYSRMLRAYPGDMSDSGSALRVLVANDPTLKMHVAWVGCQYAAERRPEFTDENGEGPYKGQFKRAIDYFETLSKGAKRSRGETQAGKGANTGGNIQPSPPQGRSDQFVFAPSRNSPGGHGGF